MNTLVKWDRTLHLLNGIKPKIGRPRKDAQPPPALVVLNLTALGSKRVLRVARLLQTAGRLLRELERL
jgi:hypothetical protein